MAQSNEVLNPFSGHLNRKMKRKFHYVRKDQRKFKISWPIMVIIHPENQLSFCSPENFNKKKAKYSYFAILYSRITQGLYFINLSSSQRFASNLHITLVETASHKKFVNINLRYFFHKVAFLSQSERNVAGAMPA